MDMNVWKTGAYWIPLLCGIVVALCAARASKSNKNPAVRRVFIACGLAVIGWSVLGLCVHYLVVADGLGSSTVKYLRYGKTLLAGALAGMLIALALLGELFPSKRASSEHSASEKKESQN